MNRDHPLHIVGLDDVVLRCARLDATMAFNVDAPSKSGTMRRRHEMHRHTARSAIGPGFVFDHEPMMLALFFGPMAVGVGSPMLANHRERRAAAG